MRKILVSIILIYGLSLYLNGNEFEDNQYACKHENFMACQNLGVMYMYGDGVKEDKKKAAKFFRRACEAGIGDSCHALAVFYQLAEGGLDKNYTQMLNLNLRACNLGSADGCYSTGYAYDNENLLNIELKPDLEKAKFYYGKACDLGHKMACEKYSEINSKINQLNNINTAIKAIDKFMNKWKKQHNPKTDESSKQENSQLTIEDKIKSFLNDFYTTTQYNDLDKVLSFYSDNPKRFFPLKNPTKEMIKQKQLKYTQKWPNREYSLIKIELLDDYTKDSKKYYIVKAYIQWKVSSDSKSVKGQSEHLVTLVEEDGKFLIDSITAVAIKRHSSGL